MRKHLFIILIILGFYSYPQDATLSIRSIEQNNGFSSTFSKYFEFGHNWGLGITTDYNHHLFALRFNFGGELHFSSSEVNQYYNLNLLYGQELPITKWLVLEGLVGLGYVKFRKENQAPDWTRNINRTLNVPISLKVLFVTGKVFGIGINPNINLNSFQILYSTNLTLQFKFK